MGKTSQVVVSKDGTRIAFEQMGQGSAVVLVDGALSYRALGPMRPLANELSKNFAVYLYDRRGRGESTDTQPYAVDREIEDVEALIGEAGGSACLYGTSSGAVLALLAAAKLGPTKIPKMALYEPPFNTDDDKAKQDFAQYTRQISGLLKANRRGDAVTYFLSGFLSPRELENMRRSPDWPIMEASAPTLAYENAVMGDGAPPTVAARAATMPVLVMDGGESPSFIHEAAESLAKVMPSAKRKTLEGQTHNPAPDALAPVLANFFIGGY